MPATANDLRRHDCRNVMVGDLPYAGIGPAGRKGPVHVFEGGEAPRTAAFDLERHRRSPMPEVEGNCTSTCADLLQRSPVIWGRVQLRGLRYSAIGW
ncbi:hypothetical protein LshimejAT787_0700920 [Lyophyllum shimeji]|uniref:Uncharacterized protein n=1 Tax=Lyophyllum shimeji TaxID=47721 RepID=A0A9P3UNQ8_LYOSH|nr:hypothetical protein LshimejAT787_0700920 [Lyophyllum shimeji]